MSTTTDGQALLRAVLLRPDDDAPRQMLADLWQDSDDEATRARGEFVAVQLELDRWRTPPGDGSEDYRLFAALRKRERWLFHDATPWAFDPENWENRCGSIEGRDEPAALWSRGFISEVSLTLGAFLGVAARLFAAHPVTAVTIVGEGADEWPSERCVAYGRKLAGL